VMVFCGRVVPPELPAPPEELPELVEPPELLPVPVMVPPVENVNPPPPLAPELLLELLELVLEPPEPLELPELVLEPPELVLEPPELLELPELVLDPPELLELPELVLEPPELLELPELELPLETTASRLLPTIVRTSLSPFGWLKVIPEVLPTILPAATRV